jgi:hypothetical protein
MTQSRPDLTQTPAHKALRTVEREGRITSEKVTEMGRFRRRVRGMEAVEPSPSAGVVRAEGGGVDAVASSTPDAGAVCGDVVEAFEETLNTCEGTTLERAISGELGREVAAVLLRDEGAGFTPELKRAVLSSAEERASQLRVLGRALETEEGSVRSAVELVEEVDESLSTDEELLGLRFDELRQRHGTLIYLHEDCESMVQRRQETLSETTKEATAAGLRHDSLTEYLYEGLSTDHPVLSALTEAVRLCERREHEVRKHICKAV